MRRNAAYGEGMRQQVPDLRGQPPLQPAPIAAEQPGIASSGGDRELWRSQRVDEKLSGQTLHTEKSRGLFKSRSQAVNHDALASRNDCSFDGEQ